MKVSVKRVFLLLFIVVSFYWWVFIPIVHEILYFTTGPEISASVATSLFLLEPTDVLLLDPAGAPSNIFGFILFLIKPMGDLIAFSSTFLTAFLVRQNTKKLSRYFIYSSIICVVSILPSLLKGYGESWIFPCLASLSGIVVAKLILPSKRLQFIPDTRTP